MVWLCKTSWFGNRTSTEALTRTPKSDLCLSHTVQFSVFYDPSPRAKPHYHKPIINVHTNLAKTKSWQMVLPTIWPGLELTQLELKRLKKWTVFFFWLKLPCQCSCTPNEAACAGKKRSRSYDRKLFPWKPHCRHLSSFLPAHLHMLKRSRRGLRTCIIAWRRGQCGQQKSGSFSDVSAVLTFKSWLHAENHGKRFLVSYRVAWVTEHFFSVRVCVCVFRNPKVRSGQVLSFHCFSLTMSLQMTKHSHSVIRYMI